MICFSNRHSQGNLQPIFVGVELLISKRRIRRIFRRTIASLVGTFFGLVPTWFLIVDYRTSEYGELSLADWLWTIGTVQFILFFFIIAWIWMVWDDRIPGL